MLVERRFESERCGVGPRCSFCDARSAGPRPGRSARSRAWSRCSSASPAWRSARPSRTPCSASRSRPALGAVGMPDRRLRKVVPRPLGGGGARRRRASRLDGHLRSAPPATDATDPLPMVSSPSSSGSSSWSWSLWSTIRRTSTKPKAARRRNRAASWLGSSSAMGPGRLPPRRLLASDPEVQVDPAAPELTQGDRRLTRIPGDAAWLGANTALIQEPRDRHCRRIRDSLRRPPSP
jgi:hypothetical protein